MTVSSPRLAASVLALTGLIVSNTGLATPHEAQAQGQAVAGFHVQTRVAPACSIFAGMAGLTGIAGTPAADAETIPSVRVVCGRSGLRALRVSTGSGDAGTPAIGVGGRQVLAGGEVVFTVPMLLGAVASDAPITSLPRANKPATVVVTLHF